VLVLFFIVLLVVLPALAFSQLSDQSQEYGVQITNKRVFFEMLNDKLLPRHLPGFLSNAIEFRKDFLPT